jgi:glycosyltransferase involved in cell wall biosynthesis
MGSSLVLNSIAFGVARIMIASEADPSPGADVLHICHITSALRGGPATSLGHLVRHQWAAGCRVSLIYSSVRDDFQDHREGFPEGLKVLPWQVTREINPRTDWKALQQLRELVERIADDEPPSILHLHCSKAGAIGRFVGRSLGVPTVYSPRGIAYLRRDVSLLRRGVYYMVEALIAPFGGPVVAASPTEMDAVRRLPARAEMIANGVDLADLAARLPTRTPDNAGATSNRPFTVAICGIINESKQPWLVDRIVRAAPRGWRWWWIGDGDLRHHLESTPDLEILGWTPRNDTLRRIAAADVLLHASAWEGMPNVVLEAMALARPVVASDIVGNRDLVRNEETGFLIDDEADYAQKLTLLESDPGLRRRFGAAGLSRIRESFDISVLGPRWLDLYREMTRGS